MSTSLAQKKPLRCQAQPEIRLITSDVDGTLLDSQQRLSPKVEKAVQLSRSVGVPVRLARGAGCVLLVSVSREATSPWCFLT